MCRYMINVQTGWSYILPALGHRGVTAGRDTWSNVVPGHLLHSQGWEETLERGRSENY